MIYSELVSKGLLRSYGYIFKSHYNARCGLATAPVKTYVSNRNPALLFWRTRLTPNVKLVSSLAILGLSIKHIHPDIWLTVGPPSLLATYFAYRKLHRTIYSRECLKVIPKSKEEYFSKKNSIQIKKYDEASVSLALKGIENEYDNLRKQVVETVERMIKDYVFTMPDLGNNFYSNLLDKNNQFHIRLNESDVETFIQSSVNLPFNETSEAGDERLHKSHRYIKFSLPYYSRSDLTSKNRLGIIEIHLLQMSTDDLPSVIEYKILIDILPYQMFSKEHLVLNTINPYKSNILEDAT